MYYRTMKQARGALALDTGFDPFLTGGWGRCTKAKLAEHGYIVDPQAFAAIDLREQATDQPKETLWFECDAGHRWQATDEQDRAAGHKCPTCGDYWQ